GLATRGRVNTGDGHFAIWNVNWVARTLVADPANVFDANIFHPHRNTLAYSEANLVAGALGVPFYWATRHPLVTHNAVVLLAFVFSMLAAYALVHRLTGSRAAGWAAGIAFAYCPFIFARTAHIQLLMTWGIPLSLLAFHRVVERPGPLRGLVLGLSLAVLALACAYYGIFAGLIIGLGTFYFAVALGRWRVPRYWGAIALGAAVSVGVVVPFFLPFLDVQQELGFSRSLDDATMYSANWQAWLTSAAWAHRWWFRWLGGSSEVLFPGVITTVLGAAGLLLAWRGRVRADGETAGTVAATAVPPRAVAGFYALVGGLTLWSSFGPPAGLYTLFFHTIPVFSFLRAPARFGIGVALVLAVGLGFAVVWMQRRWPRRATALAVALPLALVAELATAPLALPEVPPPNPVYRMLATLRPGPVVELPFFYERPDFPRHALYMFNSTYHWQPLVNGYSDHIPQDFRDMVIPLSSFPTRESFRLLEERRARYAIFHLDFYDRRSREKLMDRLRQYEAYLTPLHRETDVWLFEISAWPR
ncbi:MAG: hypothetical protein MUF60_00280, partial [Vicinamibacterales bacterium]|nr:hypothetical protein [Vicinamibacterales bacterium]